MGFDLDTSKGVAQLLASVRTSELPPAEKNELRDLVLSYANSHEPSIKIALEQKITTYQLKPAVSTASASNTSSYPFGTTRPAPAVKYPKVPKVPATESASGSAQSEPAPVPPSPQPAPTETVAQQVAQPTTEPIATPVESPTPEPATPTPPPVTETPKTPEATIVSETSNNPPTPEPPTPTPSPVAATPQAPETPNVTEVNSAPTQTADQSPAPKSIATAKPTAPTAVAGNELARIKEIKADINALSGNPANLIDVANEAGREYMSALLNAMKTLNNGGAVAPAMQQLESAYAEVKQVLQPKGTGVVNESTQTETIAQSVPKRPQATTSPAASTTVDSAESTQEVEKPRPIAPVKKDSAVSTPRAVKDVPPIPSTEKSNSASHVAQSADNAVPVNLSTTPAPSPAKTVPKPPKPVEEAPAPKVQTPVPPTKPTATTNPPTPADPAQDVIASKKVEPRGPDTVAEATTSQRLPDPPRPIAHYGEVNLPEKKRAQSLAENKTAPHSIDELPDASSLETSSVKGDALYTREVDTGLEQLLVEWPIFKKSGLFGTGPNGIKHPLYIQIKDLNIPLLLAGRFEGATPEIKQSITDYMNGWRYEQGIVYEHGETFEHYLRRVIRHILDA